MRRGEPTLFSVLFACSAAPALGQPAAEPALTGTVALGARSVDVSGTESKYREDINLDDGVRLFDLRLQYAPTGESAGIDRLELDATGLGGDPFETVHVGVRKYGAYQLNIDRRRSQYFYEDTIVPAAFASITGSTAGDFHHFDFERVRDTAKLDIDFSPATRLSLGLERQTRVGDSTTTLDVERDEFELEKPLDESLNALTLGIRHSWDRITFVFNEELRQFDNTSELFLPGLSSGQNTTDLAELHFFMLDQSYDYESRSHAARLLLRPTDALDVNVGWRHEDLDLDMDATEHSAGTTFLGTPFETMLAGPAAVGRDLDLADADVGFALNQRVRLIGGARRTTLAQAGELVFGGATGSGTWDIETDAYEVGVEIAVNSALTLTAGWSHEARTTQSVWMLNAAGRPDDSTTERDGYFARIHFGASNGLSLTASVEDDAIDDPFALASPSASRRYNVSVRQRWDNGLSVNGSYRRTDVANDASGWAADNEQLTVRLAYQKDNLRVSAGYSNIDIARNVDQLVTAGTRTDLFRIAYAADARLADVTARWQLGPRLALGGELRQYDNRGSFALARDERKVALDIVTAGAYGMTIAYRNVDYTEDAYDAYDAGILELGLRLDW